MNHSHETPVRIDRTGTIHRRLPGIVVAFGLVGGCALDFTWPLDLPTTCERDAHCPDGLLCRFELCGTQRAGQAGEPCDGAGRCEAGLHCAETVCLEPAPGAPVLKWARSLASGDAQAIVDVRLLPDGDLLVLASSVGAIDTGTGLLANEGGPFLLRLDDRGATRWAVAIPGLAQVEADGKLSGGLFVTGENVGVVFGSVLTGSLNAREGVLATLVALDTGRGVGTLPVQPTADADWRLGPTADLGDEGLAMALADTTNGDLAIEVVDPALGTRLLWTLPDTLAEVGTLLPGPDQTMFASAFDVWASDLDPPGADATNAVVFEVAANGTLGFRSWIEVDAGLNAGQVASLARTDAGLVACGTLKRSSRFGAPGLEVVPDEVEINPQGFWSLEGRPHLFGAPGAVELTRCEGAGSALLVAGSVAGDLPKTYVTAPATDRDVLVASVDPATDDVHWTVRFGGLGPQRAEGVRAIPNGFVAWGRYVGDANPGLGTLRGLGSANAWIGAWHVP